MISIYIHIPFCDSLCDYCDFYSVDCNKFDNDYIDSFLSALVDDVKFQIEYFNVREIPTVYIGGGTPSVLGKKISRIFDVLSSYSPVEFTVEANPESLNEEFLAVCRDGGVNRLSLGVQTFFEPSRRAVNRGGDWKTLSDRGLSRIKIEEKLELASRFFPEEVSVDLITGLPLQKVVLDDIKRVLEFKPAHISLYSLTVEKGTTLYEKVKNKTIVLPSADSADAMWLTGRDTLINAGYEHYEVSNFALPGKQCLHNIRYWQMLSWIGAGPAASGTIVNEETGTAVRMTYLNDVDEYIGNREQGTGNREKRNIEVLDRVMFMKECLLMGYRYVKGPCPQLFKKRFGCTIEECIPKTLANWKGKDKLLFLNQFLTEAFTELDKK